MTGIRISVSMPDATFNIQYSIHHRVVYRSSLFRRLTALEKKLGIDAEERHQDDLLAIAEDIHIIGIRIRNTPAPSDQERMVQKMPPDTQTKGKQSVLLFPVVKPAVKGEVTTLANGVLGVRISLIFGMRVLMPTKGVRKGKSIWKGEGEEVVNVETYALQHYERLGYKGYHCEGRIVTTLFGLLFWDIIFAPIPGAFETPYQTAPLDIFEDTFYHAREELIEKRLDEISKDNARKIIQSVDDEHRERGTWCLGVRWELFPKEDLLEIAEVSAGSEEFLMWLTFRQCFKGEALACLCRVLCEDYAQRGSGVPDLFIWNYGEKHCKFVEVKGPGDRLQENQKVRIPLGCQAGMHDIQICPSALD